MRLIDADALKNDLTRFYNNAVTAKQLIDEQPTVGGWISVKDRLPDTYKRVITYDKYSVVKENWLLMSNPCVSWSQGFHVTHWMPLPEPPKEEDDDEVD